MRDAAAVMHPLTGKHILFRKEDESLRLQHHAAKIAQPSAWAFLSNKIQAACSDSCIGDMCGCSVNSKAIPAISKESQAAAPAAQQEAQQTVNFILMPNGPLNSSWPLVGGNQHRN